MGKAVYGKTKRVFIEVQDIKSEARDRMKQQYKDNLKNPLVLAASTAAIVFIGFKPLFDLAPDGISKEVLVAGIGALFVTIVTLVLLKNQTENQTKLLQEQSRQIENQKKSEQLRGKKLETYFNALNNLNEIVINQQLSDEDINKLRFAVLEVQLVCKPEVYDEYNKILQSLVDYYEASKSDESAVEIDDSAMEAVLHLAHEFSNACRKDMDLEEIKIEGSALKNSISATAARKELKGGIQEFIEIQGISGEQSEQIGKIVSTLEKQVGLQARYTKSQISLAGKTAKQKRKNVVYLNTQKANGIILIIAESTDESLATDLVSKLQQHYPKIAKKFRKHQGRYSVEIRIAWQEQSDLGPLAACLQDVLQLLGLSRFDNSVRA